MNVQVGPKSVCLRTYLINTLQGSVVTHLKCGGKYDTSLVVNLVLSPTVKEFLKSGNTSQSYERISNGTFLWFTVYTVVFHLFHIRVTVRPPTHFTTQIPPKHVLVP